MKFLHFALILASTISGIASFALETIVENKKYVVRTAVITSSAARSTDHIDMSDVESAADILSGMF